jgi:mannose-1-phosphate guanylyltransferase/mannose-6-phosphate isomerase
MISPMHRYAIILCGGSGSRLWPLSRTTRPKQFLDLNSSKSLFQETIQRIQPSLNPNHIWVVTHVDHLLMVNEHLSELNLTTKVNVLAEPVSKNTLPAIAWGTREILKKDPDAVIGVFSSDHSIRDEKVFADSWGYAEKIALNHALVLLGIAPTEATSAYGYIKPGRELTLGDDNFSVYEASAFVEKPSVEKAKNYIEAGYFWNSGMFIFKASSFLALLHKYQPDIYALIMANEELDVSKIYSDLPSVSMDYGIAEKADNVAVLPVKFSWSDLGNWNSIYNEQKKDSRSNVFHGSIIDIDSKNSLLWSDHGTIASFGLDNIVAVQTSDALLICDRNKVENLKPLIEKIKEKKPLLTEIHQTVQRPWGQYTVLAESFNYKIKRIVVNPKSKLSLQSHQYRSEHWVVVTGLATIIKEDKEFKLTHNQSLYIEANEKHRLMNLENESLEIIEIQCGSYLGEDDIHRFGDIYGRVGAS